MKITRVYRIIMILCISAMIGFLAFSLARYRLFNRGMQAYIYAYPLVIMDTTQELMTHNGKYKNIFINAPGFPTDTFKNIVRPNVDTLYSFAWLDLVNEPLILSVPDTHGRYYLIEFLDAWTNVFESIGKRTTGTFANNFIIVGPEWKGDVPESLTIIKAPTNMVLLLARTQTYGKDDYKNVHSIQARYAITPLHLWGKSIQATSLDLPNITIDQQSSPVDRVAAMDAVTFYAMFAHALKYNPPALADAPIVRQLKKIGIEPGKDFYPDNLKLTVINILNASMQKVRAKIYATKDTMLKKNGWSVMLNIGTYSTDYLTRAMVAAIGIGANLPEDAVYPTAFVDVHNNPLTGKNKYRIHFNKDQLPPVNAFWSLTLYNSENFLVKNPLNRYAVNDRDPLHFNNDGSLDIYVQHEYPGTDKENNWLPAPVSEFNLTMRLYWPQKAILDGSWQPPVIERVG